MPIGLIISIHLPQRLRADSSARMISEVSDISTFESNSNPLCTIIRAPALILFVLEARNRKPEFHRLFMKDLITHCFRNAAQKDKNAWILLAEIYNCAILQLCIFLEAIHQMGYPRFAVLFKQTEEIH